MRILIFILAASLSWGPFPVELMGSKKGLVRSGLVAAYDLRNTGDVQSVANLVAGGPALQRGSAAGADTNDPTPSLAGWVLDGTDDYGMFSLGSLVSDMSLSFAAFSSNTTNRNVLIGSSANSGYAQEYEIVLEPSSFDGVAYKGDFYWGAAQNTRPSAANYRSTTTWLSGSVVRSGLSASWYRSGALFTTASAVGAPAAVASSRYVGARVGTNHFSGTIAYLIIYSRSLSPKEVRANHNWLQARMAEVSVQIP